ncbi:DUF2339 domain-containing protein [Sphingomonas donggukensis]|uniref:DUF2339 domain-containing protein n=1 Tax=Sphingomonas donggukensis TaxID=2949093 RepID=A0ABY4TSU8_9SPHN|nr:DUF2339 domain-containing protein [Sphingomonas donggukensis]URW75488.1 DUF2339 domain-containing protein [Sphingomonas donggukensis]
MTAILLLGLMAVCAKLVFDVRTLRSRVEALEREQPREVAAPRAAPPPLPWDDTPAPRATARIVHAAPPPESVIEEQVVAAVEPEPEPEPAPDIPVTQPTPAPRGFAFEDLFGRKLPIWAGGVTLAVAGFLIVKYSIDAGLLSPLIRVLFGLTFGTALIAGAEVALRAEARVRDPRVRQALAGAGIATLYASILVAANLYQLISPPVAFVGMALVTALAGGLSLRFGAPSAVLGLVGGLAAPALVGSGSPDVPLLSAYLALAVGGLCALSRSQRWMWLGVSALVGGFGWGLVLVLGGALDAAASLSIGAYMLLLGVALPVLAFAGDRGRWVRLAGSLAACAQLAALVAMGGFGGLEWGLFALVSIAIVWLSRREAALADLPVAGLTVALLLTAAWPDPTARALALVLAGIVAIYGGPAAWRVWRDARVGDAGQVAAVAVAIVALPALHLPLAESTSSLLAFAGGAIAGTVAALGWRAADRREDARFATLATAAAGLLAVALVVVAPPWLAPPAIALVAGGVLLLAHRAGDGRIDLAAWGFATAAVAALVLAPPADAWRAVGIDHGGGVTEAVRWLIPAIIAAVFAWRGRIAAAQRLAQPVAVGLGYVAAAQVVPSHLLPLVPAAMLAALAVARGVRPALLAAGAIAVAWAIVPLGQWIAASGGAVFGVPTLVTALPSIADALLRLGIPALAVAVVALRQPDPSIATPARIAVALLGVVVAHIAYKQLFAIADTTAFVRLGLAERTLWEAALATAAFAAWPRWPRVAKAFAATSLAHFALFTGLLHNPLWAVQAVGGWPLANLLLPAYATAFAVTLFGARLALPPVAERLRGGVQMALVLLFVASTLRQFAHGSILAVGPVGAGEDILRSVALIAVAVAFLRHGIVAEGRTGARDWRIASLLVMLVAVGKVFLSDAAGLDGLLRIASFAALGFSLIGIGWLYARYVPGDGRVVASE